MQTSRTRHSVAPASDLALALNHVIQADIPQGTGYLTEGALTDIVTLAVQNKVALMLFDRFDELDALLPDPIVMLQKKMQRRKAISDRVLCELSEAISANGFDTLIIKTIRPFPYVGSDIDTISLTLDDHIQFKRVLIDDGFRDIGSSVHEANLEKCIDGVRVVIDAHNDVSAVGMEYLNKDILWNNVRTVEIRGHQIRVPSLEAELVLLAAHTAYKELKITMADFYYALYLIKVSNWDEVLRLIEKERHQNVFSVFMHAIAQLRMWLCGSSLNPPHEVTPHLYSLTRLHDFISTRRTVGGFAMPYFYPPLAIVALYAHKFFKNPTAAFDIVLSGYAGEQLLAYFKKVI